MALSHLQEPTIYGASGFSGCFFIGYMRGRSHPTQQSRRSDDDRDEDRDNDCSTTIGTMIETMIRAGIDANIGAAWLFRSLPLPPILCPDHCPDHRRFLSSWHQRPLDSSIETPPLIPEAPYLLFLEIVPPVVFQAIGNFGKVR